MLAEYEVLRRTMPISSAIEVNRWRNSSSSMACILVAIGHVNREIRDTLPDARAGWIRQMLDAIGCAGRVGAHAPLTGPGRGCEPDGRATALQFPAFAARVD